MSQRPPLPSTPARPNTRLSRGLPVLIVLAALAAYWPSFSIPFFFDDKDAILHNPTIRDLGRIARVLAPPNDGGGATGRPLVNLSLAIDYALGGTQPRGYHVTNFLLHAAASLALFGVIRRTLHSRWLDPAPPTQTAWLAAALTLCWSLHPLQTESVACVIQRTEVLAGLFALTTFYCFSRAAESPHPRRWTGAAIAACACGMASKEIMVVIPLLVLLYDRTFHAGTFGDAWRLRRGLHLGLAATWLILAWLVLGTGGSRGTAAGFGLGVSSWSYLMKQCEAIVLYLRLSLWPHPLIIDYGNAVDRSLGDVLPQAIFLVGLATAAFVLVLRRSALAFLLLWFFAILAPSSSVVPLITQTIAEHRMYLPLVAVIIVLGCCARALLGRGAVAALFVAALVFGTATFARNRFMADEIALWRDCLERVPSNARACDNLGSALVTRGRIAEAVPYFEKALALNPRSPASRTMLGDALLALGRLSEAAELYRQALAIDPTQRGARNNLGVVLQRLGDLPGALRELELALPIEADPAEVLRNLGVVLAQLQRFPESFARFEQALQLAANDGRILGEYARALSIAGQTEKAATLFQRALQAAPRDASLYVNYSSLLLQANQSAAAARSAEQAIALQPGLADAHNNLAIALAQQGQTARAVAEFERALQIDPAHVNARANLERLRAAGAR